MRHSQIVATGVHVPEREVPNAELHERFREKHPEFVEKIEKSSGIRTRWYAPDDWATSDLATRAGQAALDRAGVAPEEVDLIILGTDSPDYITPSTSVVVQDKLGAKNAGTFDVGCACASFPTALANAAGLIAVNGHLKNVLVIGAYMMRKLADPNDPMSFFYGDGAGAALVQQSEEAGFIGSAYRADGSFAKDWAILSGGTAEPVSHESIDAGRTIVHMYEKYPPAINDDGWPAVTRALADQNGFAVRDIDSFIFTQVRKRQIEKAMDALEQPLEKAHMVMGKWGYTGSACIPMALHDAIETGHAKPGDLVVLVGSGVGYNQAGAAIRLTEALKR